MCTLAQSQRSPADVEVNDSPSGVQPPDQRAFSIPAQRHTRTTPAPPPPLNVTLRLRRLGQSFLTLGWVFCRQMPGEKLVILPAVNKTLSRSAVTIEYPCLCTPSGTPPRKRLAASCPACS